jgi:nucleoid-associated protein YgaU
MARSSYRAVLSIAILAAAILSQQGCQKKKVEPAPPAEPQVGFRSMEDLAPPPQPAAPSPQGDYVGGPAQPMPVYAPQPPANPQPAPAGPQKYTVQKGDTLWSIAVKTLGSGRRWTEIQALNCGIEPSKLQVGQVLLIPTE